MFHLFGPIRGARRAETAQDPVRSPRLDGPKTPTNIPSSTGSTVKVISVRSPLVVVIHHAAEG